MFTDEILEKIFANPKMQNLTIQQQSMVIDVFEEVLEEKEREQKDATLPES